MTLADIYLSSDTKSLIKTIIEPIKQQYIDHRYLKNEARWVDRFNLLKDPSWPECSCYLDFDILPDWIRHECETQHKFSPQIFLHHIKKDSDTLFHIPDTLGFNNQTSRFLVQHRHVIQGKKIIDFACNNGRYSFLAAQLDCAEITGIDIRSHNIDIANAIKKESGLTDYQISFGVGDIHDYEKNRSLCQGKDTAFLLGIMYHVHDHFAIMESIFDSDVKYVVIDTGIFEHDKPIIWWRTEPTFELQSGWYDNHETVLVGYPSLSWFDLVAAKYHFSRTDLIYYTTSTSSTHLEEFITPRAIMLFESAYQ